MYFRNKTRERMLMRFSYRLDLNNCVTLNERHLLICKNCMSISAQSMRFLICRDSSPWHTTHDTRHTIQCRVWISPSNIEYVCNTCGAVLRSSLEPFDWPIRLKKFLLLLSWFGNISVWLYICDWSSVQHTILDIQ